MAGNSILAEHPYPCKAAPIAELDEMFQWIIYDERDETRNLSEYFHPIPQNKIHKEQIRHLRIVGDADEAAANRFPEAGMPRGFYLNADDTLLLVVLPETPHLGNYFTRYGSMAESLWIFNSQMYGRDFRKTPNLKELVLHSNPLLDSLDHLDKLPQLTGLYIYKCPRLTALPGLKRLTQLTKLTLSDCTNLTAVPALNHLTRLTRLNLSGCERLTTLSGLKNLTQLTKLDLRWCKSLTELPGLENLTQLTKLDLYGCKSLTQLPGLENLTQLTELDLHRCRSLTQLPGLENLTQLTEMNLRWCSSLTQLPGLENLTQLTELNLYGCESLTTLPGLENLTQLTKLDLTGCKSLTELPGLENLTQLTKLDLGGCKSLTQLPGLENLTQLTKLDLRLCESLTALPGLENLTQLTELNLWGCESLTTLPEGLQNCRNLRSLNLSFMNLQDLPDWLPDIAEGFSRSPGSPSGKEKAIVSLFETTVDSIQDMSIFEQPYEMVVEWFRKRAQGKTQPLNEIKVVFLGDGEAGKSHTIARLMNDGGEPDFAVFDGQSTPGIVIRNKDYTFSDRSFRVHYWDFGGQEIMHSMHRIFLTGRTMYVVLLNARDDTQSDRARYWLHNVRSFAPDAPVLLVLNKIDQNENASVDEVDLRSRHDKLTKIVRLSALKYSPEEFNHAFTDVLLDEILKTGYLDAQWPISWTQVKDVLENMATHYISGTAYQDICAKHQVDENQKPLLHWFNDLGISFCCCGDEDYALEDYVILRPDWITNALYIILFNPLEGAQNGLIPHKSIYNLLKNAHNNPAIRCTMPQARYTTGDIQYVLGIMRKFSLSFPHGEDHEFLPMLCLQNSTVNVQYYRQDSEVLEFTMDFDYLPNNLLHRLMVERHVELDMENVWRTGAKFCHRELGYSAVVVIDGNALRFFIRHTAPMHRPNTYLTMLKAHVDRIGAKMGLKAPTCQLVYKLDGKRDEFDFDYLKLLQELGQPGAPSAAHRRMIPIADILNQSAPDGLEDEKKLLDAIRKSCLHILGEKSYYGSDEDTRNRRLRDSLELLGYEVKDQTQRGLSETGKGIGELDLLVYSERKEPWAIIEALRVSGGAKTDWNKHLSKLVGNYNYFGAPCVYLLTYVDTDEDKFQKIWEEYQRYIPTIETYCDKSLAVLDYPESPQAIKTAKCRYDNDGVETTAYHIFVRVPKQNG